MQAVHAVPSRRNGDRDAAVDFIWEGIMMYGDGWMWGMHFFWWIFWILIIVIVAVVLLRRRPGEGPGPSRQTALEILERRYAAGEISTAEFEERKTRLTRTSQ